MIKFLLFLVAFDRLLTQDDLKKEDSPSRIKTELVSQDENVGIQLSEGNQVFELNGSLSKPRGRGPKGSTQADRAKVAAGYKYTTKPSKQTAVYYKGGVEAFNPIPTNRSGSNSRTSYGIKGGVGYQKELDNGLVFFVDTGLSYPIPNSGAQDLQQDKEKSSQKSPFKANPEPTASVGFRF